MIETIATGCRWSDWLRWSKGGGSGLFLQDALGILAHLNKTSPRLQRILSGYSNRDWRRCHMAEKWVVAEAGEEQQLRGWPVFEFAIGSSRPR
jgi:hypothetical protein